MRAAVVYYSLTGHTEQLADAIAAELKVNAQRITDRRRRRHLGGALRSIWQTLVGSPAPVEYPAIDLNALDLLIIGGPMWVGRPCAPVQTYLRSLQQDHLNVAFFMTTGATAPDKAFKRMSALCDKQPLATISLTEAELRDGIDSWQIHNFVSALNSALPAAA